MNRRAALAALWTLPAATVIPTPEKPKVISVKLDLADTQNSIDCLMQQMAQAIRQNSRDAREFRAAIEKDLL